MFAHVHVLYEIFASFLFMYLWLFIASFILIMGPAVLPKAMEEFALNCDKVQVMPSMGSFICLIHFVGMSIQVFQHQNL